MHPGFTSGSHDRSHAYYGARLFYEAGDWRSARDKEEAMVRSAFVKSVACAVIAISSLGALPAEAYVVHRGVTAVGPHGGVYHRGGTWAGHPGYYHGGYGYRYGYHPYYGYGAAAAVGAAPYP
jgi:hypothetical protein